MFAWYNLVGYVATATGALAAGLLSQVLLDRGLATVDAYRAIVIGYAVIGVAMAVGFWRLGAAIEAPPRERASDDGVRELLGLRRSRRVVLRLSALFSLDAFAGGFIPQSLMAYWFHLRFGVEPAVLGAIFFGANLLAAVSSLSAARIASRIGLINTMVFTHLPSNVLLHPRPADADAAARGRGPAAPLQPQPDGRADPAVLRASRWSTRTNASAAAGVTGIARTTGAAISPSLSSVLMANAGLIAVPFFLAGGLKIVYDLLLYRDFRSHVPRDAQGSRDRRAPAPPALCRASGSPRPDDPEPDPGEDEEDEEAGDRVLELLEDATDRLPVRAQLHAREDEQRGERQRAEEREDREPQDGHVGDAGRERYERADDRQHPTEEARRIAVPREEAFGPVEIGGADADVATPSFEDGPSAARPDRVGDECAERRPDRARQDDEPVVPRPSGQRLDGVRPGRRGTRRTAARTRRGSG